MTPSRFIYNSLRQSSLQVVVIVVGIFLAIFTRSAQAVPAQSSLLNCTDIYFTDSGNFVNPTVLGGLYKINTTTGAATLVGTFPNSIIPDNGNYNRAGGVVAIIGGATPTAYASSDTFAQPGANLQSFNGTTSLDLPNAMISVSANGLAAAPNGNLYYVANNNGVQQVYTFANFPNSASTLLGNVAAPIGDNIFNTLTAGDNAFDTNGRHYYFASPSGNGNTGYLYYIDPNFQAHLLGTVPTPGGATGLAFDAIGNLYTSSRNRLDKITLNNGFFSTQVGGAPTQTIIDLASCALPGLNPIFNFKDGINKKVKNVTLNQALSTQNTAVKGDVLEYQVAIDNTGNLPSDNTKFIDTIPTGTSYVTGSTTMCDSTGNTCTLVGDRTTPSTLPPFTIAGGMEVHSPGVAAGIVNAGATSAVIVKFQVKVTATNGNILNTATITYPSANSGVFTTNSLSSNSVTTNLPVVISGKIWNDLDGSGNSGFNNIITTGEIGTNANNGLFAILIDGSTPNPKIIGSTAIATNGTYSFPTVAINQTGLTIELSTSAGVLNSTIIPTPAIPIGWKNTTPKTIPAFNAGTADIANKDFGIVQPANPILVKRITAINGQTTNPHDNTDLAAVIDSPATTNDDSTRKWPSNYLKGAVNGGHIFPGDSIEYTIYYLNDGGADTKKLKICDPIRGRQTYVPQSMKLLLGNSSTPVNLTDEIDIDLKIDRANTYAAGNPPSDCNIINSTIPPTTRDNGGVVIQVTGTGATMQPDLSVIVGATGFGAPTNSYGWFRFTTKVDP
jgi:uncharacterized repeat protein (TIGR01451 family)